MNTLRAPGERRVNPDRRNLESKFTSLTVDRNGGAIEVPALPPATLSHRDQPQSKRNIDHTTDASHIYTNTEVSGQATAVLGNNYANIVNIHHTTVVNGPESPAWLSTYPCWTIRHNRILDGYTIETVVTYQEGGPTSGRGTSSQAEYRWYRKEEIGGGLYAEVYREDQITDDGRVVATRAVKVLARSFLRKLKIDYKRELNALIQLSQPAYRHMYVHFFGWYEHRDQIHVSMEYSPYGDLSMHIGQVLSEQSVSAIGSQILEGLRVMHSLDFVHRDIKPANILVFAVEPSWFVKIGDFSITKNTLTQHTTLHTDVGTIGYKAPEIMGYFPVAQGSHYSAKCDIWSLGCLLLEALVGIAPFVDLYKFHSLCQSSSATLLWDLGYGTTWMISEQGYRFIASCLTPDPSYRPDAETASEEMSEWNMAENAPETSEPQLGAQPDSRPLTQISSSGSREWSTRNVATFSEFTFTDADPTENTHNAVIDVNQMRATKLMRWRAAEAQR